MQDGENGRQIWDGSNNNKTFHSIVDSNNKLRLKKKLI